jgi:dihydroorotase
MMLRRPEYGSLKVGSLGDATILTIREGKVRYMDVVGEELIGNQKIIGEGVVLKGRWWHPRRSSRFPKIAS